MIMKIKEFILNIMINIDKIGIIRYNDKTYLKTEIQNQKIKE